MSPVIYPLSPVNYPMPPVNFPISVSSQLFHVSGIVNYPIISISPLSTLNLHVDAVVIFIFNIDLKVYYQKMSFPLCL